MIALILTVILFGAPSVAFWLLVDGLDPIGRLVVSGLAGLVLVSAVAGTMLVTGLWSPLGGLIAILVVSALMALLGYRRHRSRPAGGNEATVTAGRGGPEQAAERPSPSSGPRPTSEEGGDEWLYDT